MKKNILFILLACLIIMPSCQRIKKQDVLLLYPNWAEGIAITNLAQIILEDKGYTVTIKRLELGPIYASLSRGDADVCMDTWLPNTHKDYWIRYGNKIDILGTTFNDGITGLVVPTYVDINSIEELNANKDKFNGKIYGIASGAGISRTTEDAIKEYNLELTQISSSETSMITALKKAIAHKEWVVITGWKPHFMWAEYDLKPLKDPKNIYPKDEIKIIARKGFSTDKPELAKFFTNFSMDEKMLNELMSDVLKDNDPTIGARIFYNKHKELLQSWVVEKEKAKQL